MSEPRVRVHRPNGIQGIEKVIALHALDSYCQRNDLSMDKLSNQIYDIYGDVAIFSAPSRIVPDGLRNDMQTLPIPVLIVEYRDNELCVKETEHTREYIAK